MPRYVTDLYEIDFCNETNKYKVRNAKSKDSLFTTDTLERAGNASVLSCTLSTT